MRTKGAGTIAKRGEGRWLVRWTDRDPATGAAQKHSKAVQGTRLDAEGELAKMIDAKASGAYKTPAKATLREYVASWLAAQELRVAAGKLARKTLADRAYTLNHYVLPVLGNRRLDQLQPADLERLYAKLQAGEHDENGKLIKKGVGPRTVAIVHSAVSVALRKTGRRALTSEVELPAQRKAEVRALSPEEWKTFREVAKGTRYGALFDLLVGTGARPGEALALTWDDIDFEKGSANITKALSRPGGKFEIRAPKTPRAVRTVGLDPHLLKVLREHRARQAAQQLKLGSAWQDRGLVFTGRTGGFVDYLHLGRNHFNPLRAKAGLPESVTLYALRHSFATFALAAGASVHEVAAAMGHANPALVLSTYGHALPEKKAATFAKVGELVFG
jgi:integrase